MTAARIFILLMRAPLALWHLICAHWADAEVSERRADGTLTDAQACAYLRNRNYHQRRADALMGLGELQ